MAGAQLWPYKFVTSLLAHVLETGHLNLQTHTAVSSITTSVDGTSLVNTPRGSIRSKKIIFATNAYTSALLPLYSETIVPTKGTCSHISVPKDSEFPPPHLSNTGGITYKPPKTRDYFARRRPDGGVIIGGAKYTFQDKKDLWWGNFDDNTLFPMAQMRRHFETVMKDNFRGWEKSGAHVDRIWTGSKTSNLFSC